MIVILGDGGHAKVVEDSLERDGSTIHPWDYGAPDDVMLALGMSWPAHKRELAEKYDVGDPDKSRFGLVLHPHSMLNRANIDFGLQAMAGSIIQVGCTIGKHVLVNTGAQIDHDCVIGDYCHIGPGAVLCGNVTLGEGCVIGAGTTIVQGVELDPGSIVKAGSLVIGQDDVRGPLNVVCGDGIAKNMPRPVHEPSLPVELR